MLSAAEQPFDTTGFAGFADYVSHKNVRAVKIKEVYSSGCVGVEPDGRSISFEPHGKPVPKPGWYMVFYEDGYSSFSPPHAFEAGYKLKGEHVGLPVAGYKPQDASTVSLVNVNKRHEEVVLRVLDDLAALPDVDKRWLAIGRTAIEQGFMAANRAIFKPGRVSL